MRGNSDALAAGKQGGDRPAGAVRLAGSRRPLHQQVARRQEVKRDLRAGQDIHTVRDDRIARVPTPDPRSAPPQDVRQRRVSRRRALSYGAGVAVTGVAQDLVANRPLRNQRRSIPEQGAGGPELQR
ncbi:MAG: hypothetical protein WB760_13020, partial [Xanthobacteraceae bacterium]